MGFPRGDVLSILDYSRENLEYLFLVADQMEKYLSEKKKLHLLDGYIVALAFLEPSTRTMYSFQSATYRLGGKTLVFTSETATSLAKGENFADTIRMLDSYSDLIVIRSKYEGTARYAAELAENPVINGGDGRHEHPTQAMIDLYTMYKIFGGIDGLTIGILGDLKYARTITSFLYGLTRFKPRKVYLISPGILRLREEVRNKIAELGLSFEETTSLQDVIDELDVLYVTRIQKERYPDPIEYERVKNLYRISIDTLRNVKKEFRILHPLPKIDEIDYRVDETPYAAYFYQAKLGVPLRMALLSLVLGVWRG
ncbi:aspartate carbamoyltransferase [Staphylothermus marinus F1]|uniref:Aspartate carbamoyltransferase catalytic subunit n=1 Tax=Staphylothermus marinus (strain ATCC 43588 / DSM 3639 / JCM 9404 / F1) TaxID=399550 RepID=PYRB_STAMF|nr:aspartate carbamoyltransferase [Staphylothermus marinus]A3DM48.1 RecName: Full=Aspartate carbamoyltransferase catalytic subunit; AltName: Full=Aspartate transcarbamylase; Short=ATCase [Staphylothermus marinus F1]ABN69708.1 aspartate carbamoyltransferase [Staphylothermus marinus F1]